MMMGSTVAGESGRTSRLEPGLFRAKNVAFKKIG